MIIVSKKLLDIRNGLWDFGTQTFIQLETSYKLSQFKHQFIQITFKLTSLQHYIASFFSFFIIFTLNDNSNQ